MNQRSKSLRSSSLLTRDISESLGKLPPQAPDLEEAVLGALMLEKNALTSVIEFLRPEHFYSEAHKLIYEAIIDLFKNSEPVDMRTVVNQLRKNGKLELIGGNGAFKIAELVSGVSSAANIDYHARIIMEMSMKRNLIQMASQVHHDAYDDTVDIFELLEKIQKTFDEITGEYLKGTFSTLEEMLKEASIQMVERMAKHGIVGVPSGLLKLDSITNGFQKSELTIIAARPSMGKTALLIAMIRNMSAGFKIPVAMFSLEMAKNELMFRLMSAESDVHLEKIRSGKLTNEEAERVIQKTKMIESAPLYIDDNSTITIMEIRARARRLKAEKNIQIVVIDYLQLMHEPNSFSREQEISTISRGLKVLAKELDIAVIALAQLSRDVEKRGGNKKPILADLRESGAIEQDADVVGFLFRPEYYGQKVYDDGSSTQGVMEIIIAKHRNGPIGTAKVKFISWLTKVTNFEIQVQGAQQKEVPPPTTNDLPF